MGAARLGSGAAAIAALFISGLARADPPVRPQTPPVASAPAPTAPWPGPIPIEALAAPPALRAPTLSPDGRRVAALVNAQGKNWIGIYDLDAPASQPPRLLQELGFTTRWLRWGNANTLLIGSLVYRTLDGSFTFPMTRIIAIDAATGGARALQTGGGVLGDDLIHVDPAGRFILVSAQGRPGSYPGVARVDLATGHADWVVDPREGVWTWYADAAGIVRAGISTADRRTRLHYRSSATAPWQAVDLAQSAADGNVDALTFAGAGDTGVIVTDSETGRFAAYSFDYATGARGAALFQHPVADVTGVEIGETGQALGFSYEDERPHTFWIDPQQRAAQAAIDRALPGKTNTIVSRSAGSARMIVWSSGADDSGGFYIYDRAARSLNAFVAPFEQLREYALAEVRPVSFTARDGTIIPAYLTLPRGRPGRNLPLVLLAHGGPFARDSWTFDPQVQILANLGYAVLQPNFRGSTGYGRAFVEKGYGQFGTGMIDDMEDGIAWLAAQGTIDPARVCIMGGSYGGYAAIWAAMRAARPYRCAISFAGVSDIGAMMQFRREQWVPSRYVRAQQRRIQGEGEDRVRLAAISPLRHVDRLHVPLLIAHGEKDETVPPSQSHDLIRALAAVHANVESVFYPEAVHGFTRPEDSIDFYRRVQAFLARYNPADPTPAHAPAPAGVPQQTRSR